MVTANALEYMDEIPDKIKSYFPDLSNKEWQAALRAITVILISMEKHISFHTEDKKQQSLLRYILREKS